MAAAVAARENVAGQAGGGRRQRLDGCVAEARLDDPPDQIVAAEPARRPGHLAAGEHDVAARGVELLGDLAAGLAAADHEDSARGQLRLAPVVLDVELVDGGG